LCTQDKDSQRNDTLFLANEFDRLLVNLGFAVVLIVHVSKFCRKKGFKPFINQKAYFESNFSEYDHISLTGLAGLTQINKIHVYILKREYHPVNPVSKDL